MNLESKDTNQYSPEWVRPNLENERGELERVAVEFLGQEADEQTIDALIKILQESPIVELSDIDWELLENTDSFHNVDLGQIEKAQAITEGYNQELDERNKRNFANLKAGFKAENKMECPVILRNTEGNLHLVSGNTRLMISRALGVRPKVLIGQVE